MNDFQAIGRRSTAEIAALNQGRLKAPQRGVPRDAHPQNASADNEDIE
jgi:hypothetical protein